MKKTIYISLISILFLSISCYDRTVLDFKEGVSLSPVSGLKVSVDPVNSGKVILTWTNPTTISDKIKQPCGIYIEIFGRKTTDYGLSDPRLISYDSYDRVLMLPTPGTYSYTLNASYQIFTFIVKTHNEIVSNETNYETNIYSLGQSVVYKKP